MKILLKSKKKNYLVTLAIGSKYYKEWIKYAYPSWRIYCSKYDIGIICFNKSLIEKKNEYWKKIVWQQLLIPIFLDKNKVKNVCYVDTDIIINPFSPDIFKNRDPNKIYISSKNYGLPYNLNIAKKRLALLRKEFINKNYPLDSGLFATSKTLYNYSSLEPKKDDICSGVYLYNLRNHGDFLSEIFYKYKKNVKSMTSGGIQVHLGWHIINSKNFAWLEYKFQAYWVYEVVINYPFLYYLKNKKIIIECVKSCLMNNYFLHFAGAWEDSGMWKNKILNKKDLLFLKKLHKYYDYKPLGYSKGFHGPKD